MSIKALEPRALKALRAEYRPTPLAARGVNTWLGEVETRLARGGTTSVMEHVALGSLEKSPLGAAHPEIASRARSVLSDSFQSIAGVRPGPDQEPSALPLRALRKRSAIPAERFFHDAVVRERDPGALPGPGERLADVAASFRPGRRVAVAGLAALSAVALDHDARSLAIDVAGGAVVGYPVGSWLENFIHRHLGHKSPALDAVLKKVPWVKQLGDLDWVRFSHDVVHHKLTFVRKYTQQFAESGKRSEAWLVDVLRRRGYSEKQIADFKRGWFGLSLTPKGAMSGATLVLPIALGAAVAVQEGLRTAGVETGPMFDVSAALAALPFLPASANFHPYLHLTKAEGLKRAGAFMRNVLTAYYGVWARIHHSIHHGNDEVNFNLVPMPRFLGGEKRSEASLKHLVDMAEAGEI